MIVFLSCPTQGYTKDEVTDFKDAASNWLRARGDSLLWHRPKDKPTMACRNSQVRECLTTPATHFASMDHDCIPTRDGQPDMIGLGHLLADLERDEIDVVFGWSLIGPINDVLVPCVVHAQGADPSKPTEYPIDFVAPYSDKPLVEIKGGVGTHCFMVKREVLEAMKASGRLPFEDIHDRDPESKTWGGRTLGHDLSFCQLAQDLGFRVWMDNRVFWGHDKRVDLRWVHDIVRGLALRMQAHESVAAALYPKQKPWVTLRAAEEEARGRKVRYLNHSCHESLKDATLLAGICYDMDPDEDDDPDMLRTFIVEDGHERYTELIRQALNGRQPARVEYVGDGVVVTL